MKKGIALLLVLAMVSCFALAEDNWYVEAGQALALRMQALAADEAYVGLMVAGNDEMGDLKDAFVQADLSKPTGAWFMALPDEAQLVSAMRLYAALEGDESTVEAISGLTDVGMEKLAERLPASAASVLTGRAGIGWLLLSNVVNVGEAKEEPEGFTPGYLLLEYPDDFAALITFTRPLPGYASVSASPVPSNSLETIRPLLDYGKRLGLSLELETLEIE